ncbi:MULTISPECIES: universal stress protein [unclassified Xanthobacter]|uniref:universal stress protein n=1 Tax=unclassified Xanthobacter TaxID=2623496 RepID=UPI001EDCFDB3|nr:MULTISPECIES: universal stress protein [unclassified Xanthobacter]
MLKRILLLLGDSAASASARAYAFQLAQETGAGLAGLAGIDLAALAVTSLGRAGAGGLKVRLERDLRAQAEDQQHRLRAGYQQACADHGVPFEWLAFEGAPLAALQQASETRDLLVTGCDTGFQGGVEVPLPDLLARLLALTPRPCVVCGEEPPHGGDVLVAYDGSVPAMRSVQMFALIGLATGRKVRVISVDPSQEEAARRASAAVSYLESHGYQAEAMPITSRISPPDVLRLETANVKASLLVMGSYGHRGLKELLFGSTTHKLVENPPAALFVYH